MDPAPWAEGDTIPWNEPGFSRRMLQEHLSQEHDAASRRTAKIRKHVRWIHETVLARAGSRVLDLGCGPGLYAARLATLGHACRGIDFSPASIEYAVNNSPAGCSYTLGDLRTTEFGSGYDLAMFIFGEMNVFKPEDIRLILGKAHAALNPGGRLLLEVSTWDDVEQKGNHPSMWYSSESGLFSDDPHLCLMESFWNEERSVATERYWIVDPATGRVTRHSASSQAYTTKQYRALLSECGFRKIEFLPSLIGEEPDEPDGMQVLLARK
jgi:SAM-dependent methyltransferase